jgi:hypothetical protein
VLERESIMSDVLLGQLLRRVDELDAAYADNEEAFATFKRAEQQQKHNPCDQNKHELATRDKEWRYARDEIVNRAQYLMGTLALVMVAKPYSTHDGLIKQASYLKDAFHDEAVAFNRYSNISGGSREVWQQWQDTRGEIISRARPLIDLVKALPSAVFESSVPTEVGS